MMTQEMSRGDAGRESAAPGALVAHGKAFFALVGTNDNYPAERREFAREIAQYIRDEAEWVEGNRIVRMRTDLKAYTDSRLEYGRAADKVLDDPSATGLETLIETHANESLELGCRVRSSYEDLISTFTMLIEMEAVSDGGGEALDAGYLQTAYHYLDVAGRATVGSAHRAWSDDVNDRGKLYLEMDADFTKKVDEYRNSIEKKACWLDALHTMSDGLCKKGIKITGNEFKALIERNNLEQVARKNAGGKEGYA